MSKETRTINNMPAPVFTALALLFVYFSADLAYPGVEKAAKRRKLLQILQKAGYLTGIEDVEDSYPEVSPLYNETICEHAKENFPEGWEETHDYWGCRCIAYKPGWNAPKTGTYLSGDTHSCFAAFDSAESLWEETDRILQEIEEKEAAA
jgi:hypothetical protein